MANELAFLDIDQDPGEDAPRDVQRVWRMKLEYNKLMDKAAIETDAVKQDRLQQKMREIIADLTATEYEAKAKMLKQPGVNIELPVSRFQLKSNKPNK